MYEELVDIFKKIFPMLTDQVLSYRPHGKNSLIIWFDHGRALEFTKSDTRYFLEPYIPYIF